MRTKTVAWNREILKIRNAIIRIIEHLNFGSIKVKILSGRPI
ncbi:hypothetical protein [Methanosarcina sp. UBA5]|nr:hypothetical protein [Methanosarcina sp. UBA5]